MRIRTHSNPFHYRNRFERLKLQNVFPNYQGKLDLEIGFGRGWFIKEYAQANVDRCIIGAEIRRNAVACLQESLQEKGIDNVCLINGNGQICLEDMFESKSLDNIFIFHPDPWLKKKHHKRRLINKTFLSIAQRKLKESGKVYLTTDVSSLWEEIMEAFEASGNFIQEQSKTFWEQVYFSRWNEISKESGRDRFFGCFSIKP